MQKSVQTGIYFDYLVTDPIMGQICIEVTGRRDYEVEFVENDYHDEFLDAKYNQGRLGSLICYAISKLAQPETTLSTLYLISRHMLFDIRNENTLLFLHVAFYIPLFRY